MALFVTGDTHGYLSISRLASKSFPEGKNLTKDDYVVVLGDFGFIWANEPNREEIYWLKWLQEKPFTTLFVDGNHENHRRLLALPTEDMFGAPVGVVGPSVYHLKRGEVYTICDKKIFAFGGAQSTDKHLRVDNISWWKEEVPCYAEMDYGLRNLEEHQYAVDYIFAHTCPMDLVNVYAARVGITITEQDPTTKYLQHVVDNTKFEKFFCGHWHEDINYGKFQMMYEHIVRIA